MPHCFVKVVLDKSVRLLCKKAYYGHKGGCPNFGRRETCPHMAPLLSDYFDLSKPVMIVWLTFNLKHHREKMRLRHPDWSRRQLDCCLYWQASLYKRLRGRMRKLMRGSKYNLTVTYVPEAMGVNITETMRKVGVELEWPPKNKVRKVALIGVVKC